MISAFEKRDWSRDKDGERERGSDNKRNRQAREQLEKEETKDVKRGSGTLAYRIPALVISFQGVKKFLTLSSIAITTGLTGVVVIAMTESTGDGELPDGDVEGEFDTDSETPRLEEMKTNPPNQPDYKPPKK